MRVANLRWRLIAEKLIKVAMKGRRAADKGASF
jgi:hypothetical protein